MTKKVQTWSEKNQFICRWIGESMSTVCGPTSFLLTRYDQYDNANVRCRTGRRNKAKRNLEVAMESFSSKDSLVSKSRDNSDGNYASDDDENVTSDTDEMTRSLEDSQRSKRLRRRKTAVSQSSTDR